MRRPFFHHHKHTGKLIHHRHTSYPILFALVLVVGGLLFMTDRVAKAEDLIISATVPASIPAGAPVFTEPAENSSTSNASVRFAGTCPIITPVIVVALYEGPTLLGSGVCLPNGSFAITTTLSAGAHTIVATVVTITNDSGESSSPLHLTYTPLPTPSTPAEATPSSTRPVPNATTNTPFAPSNSPAPLDIITDQPFVAINSHRISEWRGRFTGGESPYTVKVDWGDGSTNTYTVNNGDTQTLSHRYKHNQLYTVRVTLHDSSGLTLTRSYAAVRPYAAPINPSLQNNLTSALDNPYIDPFMVIIIAYLCTLIAMLMMWRYEHIHYPHYVIGVPIHYAWQKSAGKRR